MVDKTDKWPAIFEAAKALGAGRHTILKWRQRGVPYKWQIKLNRHTDGALSFDDFARVESSNEAAE